MTLGQCHNTDSGHGQKLCKVLSNFNLTVGRYLLDNANEDGQKDMVTPVYMYP